MSAIGATFSNALGSLGGPGIATVLVAAGLAAGAVGGGLVAGGGSGQGATSTGGLAVYACPGNGAPLVTVKAGQRLLATGRTADGTWLRIHFPEPARTEAWVEAGPLQVKGAVADLPVAECAPELAVASPSFGPGPSLTAVGNFPPSAAPAVSPAPTPSPTPTPAPTATPNPAPSLSSLTVSTGKISYDQGDYCPKAVTKATFRVKASDADGLVKVTLFWRAPGSSTFVQTAMSRTGGTATNGTWQVTLDTTANNLTRAGDLDFYAVGTDTGGATKRIPKRGSESIRVAVCVNTGPDIGSIGSSAGSSLFWDPLGSPANCQTATDITAKVTDVDGIKSVTLFFRRPGSATWDSKPMDDRTIKGKWYANLDTRGDKITIPDPPTDNLRWYLKAVDDKGLSTKTSTRTTTIRRCDTEADFGTSSYSPSPMCPSRPTSFFGSASDPDGIDGSSAVLVYTYILKDGTSQTSRKRMTGTRDGPWYYQVSLQPGADWRTNRDTFTFHIETTDQFGGVSTGGSGKATVTNC